MALNFLCICDFYVTFNIDFTIEKVTDQEAKPDTRTKSSKFDDPLLCSIAHLYNIYSNTFLLSVNMNYFQTGAQC